ncbi:hypothetical protein HZB88_01420 [archaeon]|nr:hypothetical protein [archaeon]
MKKYLTLALLVASLYLYGCSSEPAKGNNPQHFQQSATSQIQIQDDKSIRNQLRIKYGDSIADYATQIISNGKRIRESPGKQANLYDNLERKLIERFPLINPQKLFGFIDEMREAENVAMLYTAQERVLPKARKDGISLPLSFVIASLSNEGHSLDVDRTSDENGGFFTYGLDTFGSEFRYIIERGYLSHSFKDKFTVSEHINEIGRRVKSANFKTKQDAFEAFVATLAHRQYLFFKDLKKNKINRNNVPSEQQLFFTYKYYNGGPNSMEKLLRKRSAKELDKFFRRTITYGSTGNAYVVLTGHLWLQMSGATDPNPNGKYWWSK